MRSSARSRRGHAGSCYPAGDVGLTLAVSSPPTATAWAAPTHVAGLDAGTQESTTSSGRWWSKSKPREAGGERSTRCSEGSPEAAKDTLEASPAVVMMTVLLVSVWWRRRGQRGVGRCLMTGLTTGSTGRSPEISVRSKWSHTESAGQSASGWSRSPAWP